MYCLCNKYILKQYTVYLIAECQALTSPTDGNVTLSSNGTLTTATFTCEIGYSLDGKSAIQCLADGTWSNSSPTCRKFHVVLTGTMTEKY